MSNAIMLRNAALTIPSTHIDVGKLKALFERVADKTQPPSPDTFYEYVAWCFLYKCTEFTSRGIKIRLGEGRSMHTWRDLCSTLIVLRGFMHLGKVRCHELAIADEASGFKTFYRYKIVLDPFLPLEVSPLVCLD